MSSQSCLFPYIESANQETIDLLLEARNYARAIHGRCCGAVTAIMCASPGWMP